MTAFQTARCARITWPTLAVAASMSAACLPAAAQFITSDRTIASNNPLNGNYIGQTVWVGVSSVVNGVVARVPNVQVDVVAPAVFSYNDQTGGGLAAYSNSVVRIAGGTFNQISMNGFGGGVSLSDTSSGFISGGNLRALTLDGAAPGVAGARATVSGGLIENGVSSVAYITNGTLDVNAGTLRAQGSQSGVLGWSGSVINVNGGLVQSLQGAAIYVSLDSALTMTGGTATGGAGGVAQWGVRLESVASAAALRGGTVNGGVRANTQLSTSPLQAALGGAITVNGGVFAYANAAVNVTGGNYTRFAGADASFFAMGRNTINFFGTDLALSGPTPGSVFELNNYTGNFYTFTSGTFSDGQSAVGLRLFDAVSVASTLLPGGFTLNPSPVPEPSTALLLLLALPAVAVAVRRRGA